MHRCMSVYICTHTYISTHLYIHIHICMLYVETHLYVPATFCPIEASLLFVSLPHDFSTSLPVWMFFHTTGMISTYFTSVSIHSYINDFILGVSCGTVMIKTRANWDCFCLHCQNRPTSQLLRRSEFWFLLVVCLFVFFLFFFF